MYSPVLVGWTLISNYAIQASLLALHHPTQGTLVYCKAAPFLGCANVCGLNRLNGFSPSAALSVSFRLLNPSAMEPRSQSSPGNDFLTMAGMDACMLCLGIAWLPGRACGCPFQEYGLFL